MPRNGEAHRFASVTCLAQASKAENRGVVVTEAGSYSRLIDSLITQLKAQGPSSTCNESKEEEEKDGSPIHGS